MGIFDAFKGKQYKAEAEQLSQKVNDLQNMLSPEEKNAVSLQETLRNLNSDVTAKQNELEALNAEIEQKKKLLYVISDEMQVQDFGLYIPTFEFANALGYKDRLDQIRQEQKDMIKNKQAVTGATSWTVNGNLSQGKKMVSDMQKLLLRAFNSECDEVISKVKYTNFDTSMDRIRKQADAISKLGAIMSVSITPQYVNSKMTELRLAFEYQQKKQEEKEAAQAARAEMREAAKLQKEIEEQRKKLDKEQTHYQNAYKTICDQLKNDPQNKDLIEKKEEMESRLAEIDKAYKEIDYREANQRAGYVYIISNIGAFGENVYKIGMTRRLDPQERIDELGDASVPFNFDVHAMIFSQDAPALEAALHKAFESRKVNMVNHRREFFYATLDEIKQVIRENFDKTVEFIDIPDAEQYRVSMKMRQGMTNK